MILIRVSAMSRLCRRKPYVCAGESLSCQKLQFRVRWQACFIEPYERSSPSRRSEIRPSSRSRNYIQEHKMKSHFAVFLAAFAFSAAVLPAAHVGSFPQSLMDGAKDKGWLVISMKKDWRRIFAFEQ